MVILVEKTGFPLPVVQQVVLAAKRWGTMFWFHHFSRPHRCAFIWLSGVSVLNKTVETTNQIYVQPTFKYKAQDAAACWFHSSPLKCCSCMRRSGLSENAAFPRFMDIESEI
jgi:hypothetical protein